MENISRTYIAQAACGGCESARAMDFSAASSRPSAVEKRAPPSSKAAAKAVNRGAREGPAQLMSMSSTEEASPFTFNVFIIQASSADSDLGQFWAKLYRIQFQTFKPCQI